MDWLVIWGVAKAAGLFAKPILEEFAKDTGKDFAKDFFKDGLKKVIHLPEPNILKEAYGKALKEFLQLMEQELVNVDCREEQIREYIEPLKQFVRREDVAAILGTAFELNCKSIDTRILNQAWAEITSPSLPDDFDWELVSKLYVRSIKKIINESEKLRSIHAVQAQISTAESIGNLAGIAPEFNLRTYAEGLQEQYGTVKLESLDTTGVYYSDLKLWKIFIPQNVRECQEFLPQVYELPKEHGRRLRDKGQVDEAEITEAELERYHRAYRSQVNRSILEIVAGDSPAQKVVILGDPGAGKSSLLQYLALIWAELPIRDLAVPPTPLLVELRTYARDRQAGTCKDILTFLHGGNITCRLDQRQLHDKLKAGHAIALFDGIDEVGNIISATYLENILTEYLRGIIEKGEPLMVARQMIYQLRHRNFILCYLGADSYAFVHRTFLEYFCAWEFVWQFKETQTLTVEQLKNEVFAPHWQDESWHEVLRLISGMIDAKFVAEMIDYLLEQKIDRSNFLDKENRLKKEGLSNLLLAADCFAELRKKQEIVSTSLQLMKAFQHELNHEYPYMLNEEMAIAFTSLIATFGEYNSETLGWLKGCLKFNSSDFVPQSALSAITKIWKDNLDTLLLLQHCVQHNDNWKVRDVAVREIANNWKEDSATISLLQHCIRHDDNWIVRYGLILVLIDGNWMDDPDIFSLIEYCFQNDNNYLIREVALIDITYNCKDRPQMFKFLWDIVIGNPFQRKDFLEENHRLIGLKAITENYPDRSEVLDLLLDRSQNDPDEQVRKYAEEQLVLWRARTA
jgi:hypothetical protein